MPLENANFIQQLDKNNPIDTDPIANGDDHLRMIKRCLLNSLAGLQGVLDWDSEIKANDATSNRGLTTKQQTEAIANAAAAAAAANKLEAPVALSELSTSLQNKINNIDDKLEAPVQESELSTAVQNKLNSQVQVEVFQGIRYLDSNGDNWSASSAGKDYSFKYNILKIGGYKKLTGRVERLSGGNSSITLSNFRWGSTPNFGVFSGIDYVSINVTPYDNTQSGNSQSSYAYAINTSKCGISVSLANSGDVLQGFSISIEGSGS